MADNIQLNAGTGGAVLAADDVGGVQYQRVKNVFGADGSATDVAPGAGLPIAGQYTELSGSASANATDLVASTDVRAYKSWSLQLTGTFTATVQVQGSNDNTNWFALPNTQAAGTTTLTLGTSLSATGIFTGPISCRYLRVRTTAYTSGTVTGTLELTAQPLPLMGTYIAGAQSLAVSGTVDIGQSPVLVQTLTATAGSGNRTFGPIDFGAANPYTTWYASWTAGNNGNFYVHSLEFSHDNVNWFYMGQLETLKGATGAWSSTYIGISSMVFGDTITGPVVFRYMRLRANGTLGTDSTLRVVAVPGPFRAQQQEIKGNVNNWNPSDGMTFTDPYPVSVVAAPFVNRGGSTWDRLRAPATYKNVSVSAAGNTAVWTPATYKIRLMKYKIIVPNSVAAASAGDLVIQFNDAGVTTYGVAEVVSIPAAPVGGLGAYTTGWCDLGNHGFKSANNGYALNVNLSFALTAGSIRVIVAGIEEA